MKISELTISPLVVLFGSKILGIVFTNLVFSLGLDLKSISNYLQVIFTMDRSESFVLLSSYSDLFMFTMISVALVIMLFVNYGKNKTILDQHDVSKELTLDKNIIKLIFKLYKETTVWFLNLYLGLVFILINVILTKTFFWIFLLALILSISLTLYFYFDLKKEYELSKQKLLK